jgi:phosphoribosylanthranilate isomerase
LRVKICGITNLEDALFAAGAGADALGFVFYEGSPRYIEPKKAREIVKRLPPFIERVGLFVEAEPAFVEGVCDSCGMSLAQLHWDVDEEYVDRLGIKALPVVRARASEDIRRFAGRYRLVDAYVPQFGGAGKRVALEWFAGADTEHIVLAGGLTPGNVAEARKYGFWGVDVSSGVEAAKGKKDPRKVAEFIKKAKFG